MKCVSQERRTYYKYMKFTLMHGSKTGMEYKQSTDCTWCGLQLQMLQTLSMGWTTCLVGIGRDIYYR